MRRRLRVILVLFLTLVALMIIFHPIWLPLLYRVLDVTESPEPAQALVVLGGGATRAKTAVEIYSIVKPTVITVSGDDQGIKRDAGILTSLGVPQNLIHGISNVNNTFNEAQAILQYLNTRGVTSAVIVTDAYHSRRARATYTCLDNWNHYGIDLRIVAADEPFSYTYWWENSQTRQPVLDEWVKSVFYLFRYGVNCF